MKSGHLIAGLVGPCATSGAPTLVILSVSLPVK